MAIEPTNTTPPIFNPAAAVDTVSRNNAKGNNSQGIHQPDRGGGPAKVNISPQISAVSRARAASGDANLSAETIAAISSGKIPPQIAQLKIPDSAQPAAQETAQIQTVEAADIPNAESFEALQQADEAFTTANSLAGSQPSTPQNVEILISPPPAPVPTQDTATAALGNTVDTTV